MNKSKHPNPSQRSSDEENFQVLSLSEDKSESFDLESVRLQQDEKNQAPEDQTQISCKQKQNQKTLEIPQIKEDIQLQTDNEKLQLRIEELQKQNQQLQDSLNKKCLEQKKMHQQQEKDQKRIKLIQKQFESAKSTIVNMEKAMNALQIKIRERESRILYQSPINQLQNQIQALKTKIQYFMSEQLQIRQKIETILSIKPKEKQKLSTLIQSVLIDLNCNLKQIAKEIQQVIEVAAKCGPSKGKTQRGVAKSGKGQIYNHWVQISKLHNLKQFLSSFNQKSLQFQLQMA